MAGGQRGMDDPALAAGRGASEEAGQGRGAQEIALTYTAPSGWKEQTPGGLRKAAFDIEEGALTALVTVIELGPEASGAMENINRWRQQVGLGPTTPDELQQNLTVLSVDGYPAMFVEMVGPKEAQRPQTILGVIALVEKRPWFFKFQGDSALAESQKQPFLDFLKSVQFEVK